MRTPDNEGRAVKFDIAVRTLNRQSKTGGKLNRYKNAKLVMHEKGTDPNLMGVGIPGGKLNSGSGSDKREAFSILNALFKSKRETTLEVWRMIRDYNAWPYIVASSWAPTRTM